VAISIDSGLVATDDPLANDLAVSMDEQVGMLDKDVSQFTTMLMKLSPGTAKSFKEEWLEDQFLPKHTALSVSAASADTNLAVTTSEGAYAKAGDIVLIVQTGEHVRITTAGASAWTVVRAIGSVSAATAVSGSTLGGLMIVAGSNAEGATLPAAIITGKSADYNYVQRVRNPYRFTATAEWTKWYSGNPLAYHRKKVGIEHKRELENILFKGVRSYTSDGGNGAPLSTAGGLDFFISAATDAGGTFDKAEFNDFLREAMEYGDRNRKVLFCAPIVSMVLSEFLQDNWVRARPEDNIWGVKVDAVIEPAFAGGRIPVIVKGDWKRYGEGTGNHIGSQGVLVDMSQVELLKAPATNAGPRFATLYSKRQARDADETAEEFLSEFTVKVKIPSAHRFVTGVTG
jgi:hypothetical protein